MMVKAASKPKRVFISPARDQVNKTIFQHPLFNDVAEFLPWALSKQWPEVDALNKTRLSLQHSYTGKLLMFVEQTADLLNDGMHYEQRIFQTGVIATRKNNWHDLFNAMMWLKYPQMKSALNARQWRDVQTHGLKTRTPGQCAMTLFDEAGAIVTMPDAMLEHWQQHHWHALFVEHADAWRAGQARVTVFGHALLDHALVTETLLVAKCIVHPNEKLSEFDEAACLLADQVHRDKLLQATRELRTLPLCGIPGWHSASDSAQFVKTAACFSPLPVKKMVVGAA
jgi:Protein of unknown function (DUF3025)